MRLVRLAPALAFVSLGVPAAHAQVDAAAEIEGFLTNKDLFSATSATVGSVTQDGDTVRVENAEIRWSFDFGTPEVPVKLEASVSAPTLEVARLAESGLGERWSAERIAMPTLSMRFSMESANEGFQYDLSAREYVVTGAEWGKLPEIQANAAAPVSRFAPLIDWAVDQSYTRSSIAGVDAKVVMPDSTQEITYGAMEVGPARNGVIEAFTFGEATSTQTMQVPNPDPNAEFGSTVPMTITMRGGASRGAGFDGRPMAQLFTGSGGAAGAVPVAQTWTVDGMTMQFGDMVNVTIGPSTMEGFTIDPARGPLLTALDPVVTAAEQGGEPNPEDVIGLMLDIYGAFGVERYSLASVDAAFTGGTAKMGELAIEGLSAAGLDRFSLSGLDVEAEGTTARLGSFELAGFVFPSRDAFMSVVMGGMAGMQPDFQSVTAAMPLLGSLAIADVGFENPALGSLSLAGFETRLENYINAIPTRARIALNALRLPVAMLPDPTVQAAAQELGLSELAADGDIRLGWDRDSQRVELDNDITVTGVGQLQASAALAGIPAYLFEDPARAQEALATAALVGLSANFNDQGITRYVVNLVATMSGVSPQEFVEGIVAQAQMQAGMLTGDQALGEQIGGALSAYLTNPRSLRIELAPANPVPVAQMMGAAMTAPQTLPGLLNFSISANQ